MAITLPDAGGEPDVLVEINTTPLIDVMLVLLIMLIITIPVQLHSVSLDMPVGQRPAPADPPPVVLIVIGADGGVRWNGETLPNGAELEVRLAAAAAQAKQPEVHIRPHGLAPYAAVAAVMAAVQRRHLTRIGLVGSEQFI